MTASAIRNTAAPELADLHATAAEQGLDRDAMFSAAEADELGYILKLRDCCDRLALERHDVAQLLNARPDAPLHLPHVRVRSTGRTGLAYRVRSADLEALAARISTPPLPPDPMRPRDALAILRGRRQLPRAITRYVLWNSATRVGRAEVEAYRRTPALAKRLGAAGLVNTDKAAKLTGYTRETVMRWGQKGLYGAQKIAGRWWFPADQLPPKRQRQSSPPLEVRCSVCDTPMTRKASEVRRTLQRGGKIYCDKCWAARRSDVLQDKRTFPEAGPRTRARMSEAQRQAWQDGKHDPDHMRIMRDALEAKIFRSWKRTVARANKVSLARGGDGISSERAEELERAARSRAAKGSGRKPRPGPVAHHLEWATRYADIRDFYERQLAAENEPMPKHWQLCLEVAMEDYQDHPERWQYEPTKLPAQAADRVAKALKALQIAQSQT